MENGGFAFVDEIFQRKSAEGKECPYRKLVLTFTDSSLTQCKLQSKIPQRYEWSPKFSVPSKQFLVLFLL